MDLKLDFAKKISKFLEQSPTGSGLFPSSREAKEGTVGHVPVAEAGVVAETEL